MTLASEVLEAEGELWNGKTFSAHPDDGLVLYCFEETKQAMGFDPETQLETPSVRLDFGLEEDHPKGFKELARELAFRLAPKDASGFLYQQQQLANYMKDKEGENGAGTVDRPGSGAGAEGDTADGGVVAQAASDPGDEAGQDLDVSSR